MTSARAGLAGHCLAISGRAGLCLVGSGLKHSASPRDRCRWNRLSSNSELCEVDAGQIPADPPLWTKRLSLTLPEGPRLSWPADMPKATPKHARFSRTTGSQDIRRLTSGRAVSERS